MKTFVISPSELSYVCNHCSYIKKNYDIEITLYQQEYLNA